MCQTFSEWLNGRSTDKLEFDSMSQEQWQQRRFQDGYVTPYRERHYIGRNINLDEFADELGGKLFR